MPPFFDIAHHVGPMDPELHAKLSRRRLAVEGAKAEVAVSPSPGPVRRKRSLRWQGGRVQVPTWVVEVDPSSAAATQAEAARRRTPENWAKLGKARVEGSQSKAHASPEQRTHRDAEKHRAELLVRLRGAEMERDAAMREAADTKAGVVARGADLDAEAERLRRQAAELREQLRAAKSEAAAFAGRTRLGDGGGISARFPDAGAMGQVPSTGHVARESCSLQAKAFELFDQRRELQARLMGLATECERQRVGRQTLEEQLAASHVRCESLKGELREVIRDGTPGDEDERRLDSSRASSPFLRYSSQETDSCSHGEDAHHRGVSAGASSARGGHSRSSPRSSRDSGEGGNLDALFAEAAVNVSPSGAHFYPMRGSEEVEAAWATPQRSRGGSSRAAAASEEANDLEFQYDWGLGLASRMSVPQALQLAKWAAAQCSSGHAPVVDKAGPESDATEGAARQALQGEEGGAVSSTAVPPPGDLVAAKESDLGRFDAPLQELQGALRILRRSGRARPATPATGRVATGSSPPAAASEPTSPALRAPGSAGGGGLLAAARAAEAALAELEQPTAELQEQPALSSGFPSSSAFPSEMAPSEDEISTTDEVSAYAKPIADLQEAIARLRLGQAAGPSPEAPATPRLAEATLGADFLGGLLPLTAPLLLAAPLSVAQAVVRRRYRAAVVAAAPAEAT